MRLKSIKLRSVLTGLAIGFCVSVNAQNDVLWNKHFGGSGSDFYLSVISVSDGMVAVGWSDASSFGTGDWSGVIGRGDDDAIIVKYDSNGNVVWRKHFGGSGNDRYYSVTAVSDGIVAVGNSAASSFGTGDWEGVTGKGGQDAIIVKYDNAGNVVWKKHFGGGGSDNYLSVTAVSDGIIAVGNSDASSFGTGDWAGVTGKGGRDAIVVKYDNAGNVIWKKNFGGSDYDGYNSVTAVSDGIVAVGYSWDGSFGNGDWAGITGRGSTDAIVVKYDHAGNVVWKKHFGGSGVDNYLSVTAVSDGIVAVGSSWDISFGNGDWAGVTGKGSVDAIVVKYDNAGNVIWKKNFGGSGSNDYLSVTAVSDGIAAVGYADASSFGTGDWAGITGRGSTDAIVVKYDHAGNVVWKKHFGGSDVDNYRSVTAVADGIVAVGASYVNNTGDWVGTTGKGVQNAIMVKYIISVSGIIGVPATATVGMPLTLIGTVEPSDATYQTITWSVLNAGTTGASISGNILNTTATGTVSVRATVANGIAAGTDYTQDFNITVNSIPVTYIANLPSAITIGTPLLLTGTVQPSNATNQTIAWTVLSTGNTGAVIINTTLHVTSVGTVLVQASIANGKAIGTDYTQEFYITANTVGIAETHCNASVRVYPNPTSGQLTITNYELRENTIIEIYNVVGQNVGAYPCGRPEMTIDVSHLAAGLYYLKVNNQVIKFIKE